MKILVSESKFLLVQNWGRIGTVGQNQVKEYNIITDAIKQFKSKFQSKAGVKWENRASASSNAAGKYRTFTEQRVA